ncbi:unnamed protein product [Paramecium pentaurelia]|uniref:Uncharacterized protein n=1 Tax=Paramecium pentaurelia TaxID=43138 RepID=A0A8S1VS76_9CILI|nr:unnamed protein product [Paramecium pentaurelia]
MQDQSLLQPKQFEVIFNRELYGNQIDANSLNCDGFLRQSIQYTSEIMICDLILLLELGQLNNQKLNISGYFELMNLIQDKAKCNQHCILKYCLINKNEQGNFQLVSKIKPHINYPSLIDQIDEFQAKLSQLVDENQGQDLDEIFNQALVIQEKFKSPIKPSLQNEKDAMFSCIQNRFFIKQNLLNKQFSEQQDSLEYFKYIYNVIENQNCFYQILVQLIEADFSTLKYINEFVKNFKNQEGSIIINDFELNNYYIINLQHAEQKIKEKNIQVEWQQSENKIQFFQNIKNYQNLQGNQFRNNQNYLSENIYFTNFQKALIKELKIKFWIFLYEQDQNYLVEFGEEIVKIFNKYQISIILKSENQLHFQKFIKIILDCDEMNGVIERILEYKINLIHKYVQENFKNKQNELNKKLDELYQINKRIYLPELKNHPSLIQQLDIIFDYCKRIQIMIQNLDSSEEVDFTNSNQLKILSIFIQNIYHYTEQDRELSQFTNKFCPNLSISKSTQFQKYFKKIEQKIAKQKLLEQFNNKQKNEFEPKNLFYSINIQKLMKAPQTFDQLQCALYQNTTWDNFHNSLIQEFEKQIQSKKYLEQSQLVDKSNKIQQLIDNIHNQYSKNCLDIFLKPPQNLKKFKLDNQNIEESEIKKKIMDFYSNQLMENLRSQLQNIQLQ